MRFRVEHLKHVGWEAYRVESYDQLVRARPGVIPFPLPDGSVRFVPVLGEARQPLQRELGDVGRLAPAVTGVGVLVPFRLQARVLPRTPPGFVATLTRPGGNITGLSSLSLGLSAKQLELLKEIIPRASRVAILGSLLHPGTARSLNELELAAQALKVQLQYLNVVDPKTIDAAFVTARMQRVDAVLVLTSVVTTTQREKIIDLAIKNRLPALYFTSEWVEAGGLLAYGTSFTDLFRRAATYVDKILKGAKPSELPVEQPTKFELVINLKTAKALGLTIPPSLLQRADQVIE